MGKSEYDDVLSGNWTDLPLAGMDLACCDCGLVHHITFRVRHDGRGRHRLAGRFTRAGRETGGLRAARKRGAGT